MVSSSGCIGYSLHGRGSNPLDARVDRLGKTLIFAKNHAHAQVISDRFDKNYPHHRGTFARVIDFRVEDAQSMIDDLIDDFSNPARTPHVAISVDNAGDAGKTCWS